MAKPTSAPFVSSRGGAATPVRNKNTPAPAPPTSIYPRENRSAPVQPISPPGLTFKVAAKGLPTVTLMFGEGAPELTGYGGWQTRQRPQRRDLTYWAGVAARTLTIPALLDGWAPLVRTRPGAGPDLNLAPQVNLEATIATIEAMATPSQNPYGPPPYVRLYGAVPRNDLVWGLNDIQWGDSIRNEYGQRVRQFFTLVFIQISGVEEVGRLTAALTQGGNPSATTTNYTTSDGETLSKIAVHRLGDVKLWHELARLNGMRDPNKVIPRGTVIKIP